jgi:hypothetical protein
MPGRLLYNYIWRSLGFSPLSLFAGGEVGVWYDPSDLTTLFKDWRGENPVTSDGDPVGLVVDKSQGVALGAELLTGNTKAVLAGWVDNGDGSFTATSTNSYISVECPVVQGTLYQYSYTIEEYTSGTLRIGLDASYTAYRTPSQGEVFTAYFTGGNPNADDYIVWGGSSFTGKVSGLSVKEVKGNHATQSVSASRPTYKTDGTYHWLEFDGVDDYMDFAEIDYGTSTAFIGSVAADVGTKGVSFVLGHSVDDSKIGRTSASVAFFRVENGGANISTESWDSNEILSFGDSDGGSTLFSRLSEAEQTASRSGGVSKWDLIGNTSTAGQTHEGPIYGLILVEDYTAIRLSSIESYLAEKSGVTL